MDNRLPGEEVRARRLWFRFFLRLALTAALLAAVLIFLAGVTVQRGNRMYPFLMDGDLVITWKPGTCQVGDVVAYRRPDTGETALSRIAAMDECTVQITDDGRLFVNDVVPAERVFYPTLPLEGSSVIFPCSVASGSVFLLDDCREEGQDSRLFGPVSKEDLLGRVVYVLRRRGI